MTRPGTTRSVKLTLAALYVVVSAATLLLFFACTPKNAVPGGPVFVHGGEIYEAEPSPRALFALKAPVRDRSVSRVGDTILSWQHQDERLMCYSSDGHLARKEKLSATAVQMTGPYIFARSMVFDDTNGFHFTLLRWTGKDSELLMETDLDLFPSDSVLLPGGQLVVAGVNRAGDRATVVLLEPGTNTVTTLLSTDRSDGFPRLVLDRGTLVLFFSAREETAGDLRLFVSRIRNDGPTTFTPLVPRWTDKPAALMGFGFAHNGMIWLPAVQSDGTLALYPLPAGPDPVIENPVPDSGGVFLPLGASRDGGDFWYLALDPRTGDTSRVLTRFDGTEYTRYPLP